MSIDAMKLALAALEECTAYTSSESWSPSMTRECEAAITALREALAQPEQEPVAVLHRNTQFGILRIEYTDEITELDDGVFNLYAELQEKKE